MKRIFILLGHPDNTLDPLSRTLADAYERSARAAGHDVRRMNIFDLSFDPILHKGYRAIQELEPDLKAFEDNLNWCEHFVMFYPNWWGTMPALLKGLWDRTFLPRFAFRMHKDHLGWDKLLRGRTARVVITCGNPPILDHLAFGDFTAVIKRSLLEFSGIKTRITALGPSEKPSDKKKARWVGLVSELAHRGA